MKLRKGVIFDFYLYMGREVRNHKITRELIFYDVISIILMEWASFRCGRNTTGFTIQIIYNRIIRQKINFCI